MASDQSNTTRTIVFADPPGSTNYVYAEVPTVQLNNEIMNVASQRVHQADVPLDTAVSAVPHAVAKTRVALVRSGHTSPSVHGGP